MPRIGTAQSRDSARGTSGASACARRLRLREAGEMERVYRALDRERQEKRREEIAAGLFWPRSATGQDKKEL